MTSVLGRKVGEPRIVRRSELSSAKQSAVHAGLTEAWTLFGKDSSVAFISQQQRLERAAQKQAPAKGLKPSAPDKGARSAHTQVPPNRNGVRLAWEDPGVTDTTAASVPTGQKEDRTRPVVSSAKQPLRKPVSVTSAASLPNGNHGNLPGLVQKSFPPYSNAHAVFGPPVDFKSSPAPQHVSIHPQDVKQVAEPLVTVINAQVPVTSQASIASVELPEATLAVLRAKIEKQKQVAQATKASLPSSSNQDQRGFQALPKSSVNTTVLDSFRPLPPSSPPPPSPYHPTPELPSRQLHGPSSPVQFNGEEEMEPGAASSNRSRALQEKKRKTTAVSAPQSYSGFSTRKPPGNQPNPPPPRTARPPLSTRSTSAPLPPRGKPPRESAGGPQRRPRSTRAVTDRAKPPIYPRPPPQPAPARVRKVCKTLPAAEGGPHTSGIITTSSWREGKKLAETILARDREGLSSTNGLPSVDVSTGVLPHVPEHGVGGAGTLLEGGGKDVESISGAEGGGSYSGLPESAVKVLHDLGADEGGLAANRMPKMDDEQKAKVRSRPWREGAAFPHQPLPKKAKATEPVGQPAKVKEPNLEVKKFLLKKQELQKKKDREEKLLKEKAQKEKEEKLKELYQRQRNMAIAGSRNKQKPQQQFETQSLASSGVVLPSAEDMTSDSDYLHDDHTRLLHPASGLNSFHSPLESGHLSPTSSLASSRDHLSASSSTSRIPVRTRPGLPLGPMNSRRVVHPTPYNNTPYPTPSSGHASRSTVPHSQLWSSHPQSHLQARPPTSKPAVVYQLPQSNHEDKLRSLTESALKLKERIAHEMEQRETVDMADLGTGPTSFPSDHTSLPPDRTSVRRNLMVRMTSAASPSELPGVGSLQEHAQTSRRRVEEEAAASKIQAAFRGHRVRKGLGEWGRHRDPSGAGNDTSVPVTVVATIVSPASPRQEGLGTRTSGLGVAPTPCNLGTLPPQVPPSIRLETAPPADLPWQQTVGDAYSVINVFNRQQEKLRETLGLQGARLQQSQGSTHTTPQPHDEMRYSYTLSFEQTPAREGEPLAYGSQTSEKTAGSPSRTGTLQSQHASVLPSPPSRNNNSSQTTPTNTPVSRQVTPTTHQSAAARSSVHEEVDTTPLQASRGQATQPTTVGEDGTPLLSSLSDSSVVDDPAASLRTEPMQRSSMASPTPAREELSPVGGRLSPRSLQLKLQTELNLLESVEESMRHLSSVEETRAVAMAQSEAATLAQLLTSEKQLRGQEVGALLNRTKAAEAERRREEEERKGEALKEQVERVASDTRRLQEETARKAAEHAAKLAKLHEESSQVARDITRQMVEAHSAATVAMVAAAQQQMKVAQDMATSVAVAATREAVKIALGDRPESRKTQLTSKSPQRSSPSLSQLSAQPLSHQYQNDFENSVSLPSHKGSTMHTNVGSQGTSRPISTEQGVDRTLQSQTGTSRPISTEPGVDRTLQSQTGTSRPISTEPGVDRTFQSEILTRQPSTEPEAIKTFQSQTGTSRPPSTEPETNRTRRSLGVTSPAPSTVDTVSDMEEGQRRGDEVETEEVEEEDHGGEDSERASPVLTEEVDQTSRSLHQRPLRRQQLSSVENSDSEAFALSQGDHSPSSTPSREHHAKQKGDSFFLFTTRMVQQYMHEEELRAQHQATLLQLREKAIREKAQAELEWLRIKKEKLERKGAIEMISALMEKEKKVLKQLKLEQAEIRRLREVQRLASTERHLILQQHKEIGKLNRSTNYYRQKVRCYGSAGGDTVGQSPTPDREMSISPSPSLRQDLKDAASLHSSISEDLTQEHTSAAVPAEELEQRASTPTSSICSQTMEAQPSTPKRPETAGADASITTGTKTPTTDSPTLKQLKKAASADADKYLAHREKVLLRRRQAAEAALRQQEKLLKKEQMLEVEEEEVTKLVGKALRSFGQRMESHRRTKGRSGEAAASETSAAEEEVPGEEENTLRAGTDDRRRPDSTVVPASPNLPSASLKEESEPRTIASEGPSYPRESIEEVLSQPEEQISEDHHHPEEEEEQIEEEEQVKNHSGRSHTQGSTTVVHTQLDHTQGSTTGVHTQLDHTASNTHSGGTLPKVTQTSHTTCVRDEYNNDTFESFHPSSSIPKLTSTPSQHRLFAEEETLNIAESISEGAVSGVSSVEGRIRVLKEQLEQRKREARRLQSEQKRRKKAILKEQEEQLKKQLEAVNKVISTAKASSLPPSDISSSHSSTPGSPLPDQNRDNTVYSSPSHPHTPPSSAAEQPVPDEVTTPSHPLEEATTPSHPLEEATTPSHPPEVEEVNTPSHPPTYSQFTQPLEVQKSLSHHDSVEEVLSESACSYSSEGQQGGRPMGGSPGVLHQEEKLPSEMYTSETFERPSQSSPSSDKVELEEEPSELDGHRTEAEEEPSGLDGHRTEAEEEPSELDGHRTEVEEEPSGLDGHRSEPEEEPSVLDGHRTEAEEEPSGLDGHRTEAEEEPSGLDGHRSEPEKEKSVQKGTMLREEGDSIGHGQGGERNLDEEVLEEVEEEEEEDDDDFYNMDKIRRDGPHNLEARGEPVMKDKEEREEGKTVVEEVEKKELPEDEEKEKSEEDEEEGERDVEEVEKEESLLEEVEEEEFEEPEEEEEKHRMTEVIAKDIAAADNKLQLDRGSTTTFKELAVPEHGQEAPGARSPMGVEAATTPQISEIAEDGPVSPELAGDVGSNQPADLPSAPLVVELPGNVGEQHSAYPLAKDVVQDLANEAFETMYQLFRSRRGRAAVHGQPEDKPAVVVVRQERNVTLTLEQKAEKITDDLLALLVRSENMYVNGLLSARENQQSPDHVDTNGHTVRDVSPPLSPSATSTLSPLHQHRFEADIHMPHLECVVVPPPGAHPLSGTHSPPPGAHPSLGTHSPPPGAHPSLGTHSPPPGAHPSLGTHSPPPGAHPSQQLLHPQVELAPPTAVVDAHHMVNSDRRSVNTVCEYAWRTFQRMGVDQLHTTDIHRCPQELYTKLYNAKKLGYEEAQCRQHYVDLVYNIAMDTIKEFHPKPVQEPVWSRGCTKGGKLVTRGLKSQAELAQLQDKVYVALSRGQTPLSLLGVRFLSGAKRPGGREIDFVDMLLIKELREEEPSWIDYSHDETQVKLSVADSIMDDLIKETVAVLADIVGKRSRKMN